ncbi:hypothetical protein VTK73DRAFT_2642 [Phialemonium thermophilum]|uniref:Uncharacterized protein n=1 Tax=Phialemonium thermophilum TaxID=223376 RepID=A0ABR3VQW9_9PEZI
MCMSQDWWTPAWKPPWETDLVISPYVTSVLQWAARPRAPLLGPCNPARGCWRLLLGLFRKEKDVRGHRGSCMTPPGRYLAWASGRSAAFSNIEGNTGRRYRWRHGKSTTSFSTRRSPGSDTPTKVPYAPTFQVS